MTWFSGSPVSKLYAGAETQTPKAVSFTESMTDQPGVAFLSHHLKLPGSELWIKQREKAKHFNIFLLKICALPVSFYHIKSNLFHDELFQGYVIVTMFIYLFIYDISLQLYILSHYQELVSAWFFFSVFPRGPRKITEDIRSGYRKGENIEIFSKN